MIPEQEIYTWLLGQLKELGSDVYEYKMPTEEALYPFVFLEGGQTIDNAYGREILADVSIRAHIWQDDLTKRGRFSGLMGDVVRTAYRLYDTNSYYWVLDHVEQQVMTDTSTNQPLLHGVVTFRFKMIGGKKA